MAKSYAERNAEAQEAGWESLYYQTQGRREARDTFEDMGIEPDRQQIWDYAEFERDFTDGQYTRDELEEVFAHYFGEDGYSMDEFYDWLGELYDSTAG